MSKTECQSSCGAKCSTICSSAPLTSPSGEAVNNGVTSQLGIFDIFKVGIGPSSSHTVGPMAAAYRFVKEVDVLGFLQDVGWVKCDLLGSLALTGVGHGTDKAVVVGLSGKQPATVRPDEADEIFETTKDSGNLHLGGRYNIGFVYDEHMIFHYDAEMPQHPNGMKLSAFDLQGKHLFSNEYLSLGGGFIKSVAEFEGKESSTAVAAGGGNASVLPYPFKSASELIFTCRAHKLTIAELMFENEKVLSGNGDAGEVNRRIDDIWNVMSECIERGQKQTGVMPVSGMKRKANEIYLSLKAEGHRALSDHFAIMDWVTLFARSVNEENACGGRIVTSPTNGAAGTLPAVLAYYVNFCHNYSKEGVRIFLATAAAFGTLLKTNASISGAEAGCQAEIGSACAMAAAGLSAVMGGTLEQIENAAEIGLEHNLGMTCDPLNGLVQVPCIERNCVASVKAITAHRLAMRGNGKHEVSFDSCVQTMYRTGLDMQAKYRETSTGGLALYARRPDHFELGEKIRKDQSSANFSRCGSVANKMAQRGDMLSDVSAASTAPELF